MTSRRPGRVGVKPAAPASLAYVLSQTDDLRWHIVFRSGPGCAVKPLAAKDAAPVALDPARPDYEVGGGAGALAEMERIAREREGFAVRLPGERHVLFVAVLVEDLGLYGLPR